MTLGRAGLTLCTALVVAALAPSLAAQDQPAETRIFSLVSAQAMDSQQSSIPVDCPDAVLCVDNVSFGSFAHAKTLSGPPVDEEFGAAIVTHLRLRDQPMLLIVEHGSDGNKTVRSYARAPYQGGRACLNRSEFDALGFLPSGADLAVGDLEICTDTPPAIPRESLATPVTLLTAADVSDLQPAKKPQFRLTPEGSSGPVILALIETERGFPNGDYYCPPDIDWETEICHSASIVIHPGEVIRRYGASDNVDPKWRAAKFKQIGAHAVRWVEGGRWLAVIEQTDEDYYYIQWKADASRSRFCLPQSVIDHYKVQAKPDFKLNDAGERCYAVRLSDSR